MFKPNSGRPGTHFSYSLPRATPSMAPPRPLTFRAPVATYAPVHYHPVPDVNVCRFNGTTILHEQARGAGIGAVGGAMAGGFPGAGVGALGGVVGGALYGAHQAIVEKKECERVHKLNRKNI